MLCFKNIIFVAYHYKACCHGSCIEAKSFAMVYNALQLVLYLKDMECHAKRG